MSIVKFLNEFFLLTFEDLNFFCPLDSLWFVIYKFEGRWLFKTKKKEQFWSNNYQFSMQN